MKATRTLKHAIPSVLFGLLFAGVVDTTIAQTNLVIDTFAKDPSDPSGQTPLDPNEVTYWSHDWGNASSATEFDPNMDADGKTNSSGAMKITVMYDLATYGGGNDCAIQRTLLSDLAGPIDLTIYTNLHYDIYVDPSSAHISTTWGNAALGGMSWYLRDPSGNFSSQPNNPWIGSNNYGAWTHQVQGLDPNNEWNNGTNFVGTNVARMGYQMWSGWAAPTGGLTNTVVYWIDNVWLEYNTNTAPPPPPTLTLKPNHDHHGLKVVDSASGQYPRQNVATDMTLGYDYGWVGHGATPVSYKLTIADYPPAADSAFQAHIFLTPTYGTENSPDWNQPNVVFVQISQSTAGVATATFRFKTNQPGANDMMYNASPTNGPVGILATVDCATGPLGAWTLSFMNDTNITLSAPDGTSTNFTMTADVAALFGTAPVRAYFGNQPNDASYRGVFTTFSRIQISGVAMPVDDSFPGPTINQDPSVVSWQWNLQADDPNGVWASSGLNPFAVNWTLPDFGFSLQVSPNLQPGSWTSLAGTNQLNLGSVKSLEIPPSSLPAGPTAYVRMIKQ